MQDQKKTKAQLVSELADLRQRLSGVERSGAGQPLRESDALLKQIVEAVRYILFVVDHTNYSVLYVNPAYERIWGRTCESLYQNPTSWLDAVFSEDRERVNAALRPDGSIRWIYDHIIPILDLKGEVYRLVGIAEDITERKQAEESLRRSEANLADAQEPRPFGHHSHLGAGRSSPLVSDVDWPRPRSGRTIFRLSASS